MPRNQPQLEFEAIRIEGGLITPDYVAKVAVLEAEHQSAIDYSLPRGLQVRDEIGRAWRIAEAHWRDLLKAGAGARAKRVRAVLALLRESFGWTSSSLLEHPLRHGEQSYPLTATAIDGRVPIVVADAEQDLDAGGTAFGDGTRRRSPFGLVQEFLNADDGSLWGLVTNGSVLRIVRDNASLTRPAWIEADLARIFGEQRYADFALLWLVLHESRFGRSGAPAHEAVLEQWRSASIEAGTAARDRLRDGVEAALRALGNGFLYHAANDSLRQRLTAGELSAAAFQQQLLRLVYRLIFLVVAEERGLLHPPESDTESIQGYREGYGLQRLRERSARRRAYDRHDDLWESLAIVFRGLALGDARLALPGLGGLFESSQCQDLDAARIGNRALLEAVFRLTWLAQDHALLRVNWRDMGTEELGSVYESLLELVPEIRDGATRFGFMGDTEAGGEGGSGTAGNARKLTGSYYTPDSLVQALLDSALEPVIARALAAENPEQALLKLAVLDPAVGSGHFLLGAARRLAGHLARLRSDGTPGPDSFRRALRDVIGHCVYGSDKNAMAVELARIALWLEAMEPGKPLAFLDHHLVHGDAVLGVLDPAVLREGIPDSAYAVRTGDTAEVVRALKRANASDLRAVEREREGGQYALAFNAGALADELAAVENLPDGTLEEVEAKRTALAIARAREDSRFRFACDAYVAAFLLPRTVATQAVVPTTGVLRNLAIGIEPTAAMRTAVSEVAASTPFLHWPIAFAQVLARGGFDCVVGNPPWEKLTLNEKEFFASRAPEITAASSGAKRKRLIGKLSEAEPGSAERRLYDSYESACRLSEGTSAFVHDGGRFPLTGSGIVNLYALFAEAALGLTHRNGRTGLVLPSGIASDSGTAPFFRHVAAGRLAALVDFENREKLFAAVDSRMKFCLLTIGRSDAPQFAFFLTEPQQRFDERRRFTLNAEDLRRLNPNTGNAPVFRSRADAELTAKIYRRVPVLVDETKEDGNPWGLSFRQGLFNMTSDSGLFETSSRPGLVPLYEAKMVHHFDHRWATYTGREEEATRNVTEAEKADSEYEVRPRYWVKQAEVEERLTGRRWTRPWLLGWRDITNATNERTTIASVLPRVGVGNKIPLIFVGTESAATDAACLLAILSSLTLDYVSRQKIGGTTMNLFIFRQLAVLSPGQVPAGAKEFIVPRVARLTCTSTSMAGWAADLNAAVSPALPPEERANIRAELDAYCAQLYGLTRDELRYILDPHDVMGPDYPSETFRVLKDGEIRQHGEFRTRRLVLEAWDRLFGSP
jgi:hypothetical protein